MQQAKMCVLTIEETECPTFRVVNLNWIFVSVIDYLFISKHSFNWCVSYHPQGLLKHGEKEHINS